MNETKRNFDQEAAAWDANAARVKLADDVAQAITRELTFTPEMDVADFGCGTGLISLRFAPLVASLTGMDTSPKMLDVFEEKAHAQGITNIRTHLLTDEALSYRSTYDVIVSSMTFHHVADTRALLARLFAALKPSGTLCVADLDSEHGAFHENNEGVFHFGFDRNELKKLFHAAGFLHVSEATAARITKQTRTGQPQSFSVFLISGSKPGSGPVHIP